MLRQKVFLFSFSVIAFLVIAGIPAKYPLSAQDSGNSQTLVAGRNVNMVSGTTLPDGDPWLQRQNEPSIAVSTRNPSHLLAGANDYRTVDYPWTEGELPGHLFNQTQDRDAWLGVFKSFDGGQSWTSTLLDGYPQQQNSGSPLSGYQAAADPVVRAGACGLFYYSGIVFNREEPEKSAVFVARFIDNNNDEEGDSIQYIDTRIVDELDGGRFKDKPWIAVGIPKKNAKAIDIGGQSIPQSDVYIVYSVFQGEGATLQSKILFRRSTDCGATWEASIELSTGHLLNQGATIAVDPRDNGHIFVAWRRFSTGLDQTAQSNAVVIARSTNEGKEFPDVVEVAEVPGPFDQPTSSDGIPLAGTAFRTNSYPSMAIDSKGRIYLAWSQRGMDPLYPQDSRVMIATSKDGFAWTTPMTVESMNLGANGLGCFEFMPTIAFAGGRLILAWFDTRNDCCQDNLDPEWICDSGQIRHTVDVRVAVGRPGEYPVFQPSVQVSRYLWALWGTSPANYYFSQVQFNPPNYPLFKGGTVPFHGDYIDIAPSTALVQDEKGVWRFNTESTDSQLFHLAWTDNRDVRPPQDGFSWNIYNPPSSTQSLSQSRFFVSTPCTYPQYTGMRNQNIYTSCITSVFDAGSPGNNKPLGTLGYNPATGEMIPRAFVIFVKNPTEDIRHYRLQITEGPDHGTASFLEHDALDELDVSIAPYSSVSRPLFVTSSDENDTVTVEVFEIDEIGGSPVRGGMRSAVVINPDRTNPDLIGDLATTETHDPDIANPNIVNWTYVNPNIVNPNIVNPNIVNPNIVNPNIVNPNIVNPNIVNPNIVNPNIVNPNIVNPNIVNPNIVNPNIVNSSIEGADVTDVEWPVTNAGNTVSSYTFKIFARESLPKGIYAQLLVYKVHYTPATDGSNCELKETPHHELLLNIVNPNIVNPNIVNPNIVNPNIVNSAIENATFFLAPGEEATAVLRLIDPDPDVAKFLQSGKKFRIQSFAESLGAASSSQAVDSDDAQQGDTTAEADSTELIISSSSLPDGTVGIQYPTFQLEASGGDGTYYWSVNSELLPPGIGFTNDGVISGIPQEDPDVTYPHIYSFLVQASSGGEVDTQNLSITINSAEEPTPPLDIQTTSLPSGTVGNYYGYTLQATGGTPPRTWSKASGTLPLGLTLDNLGVISGTIVDDPNFTYPHTYNFVVNVTDDNLDADTQSLGITVDEVVYPDLTISGTITGQGGSSISGVAIYGLPHAPTTDSYGFYSDMVPYGWSGTITPFKEGYTFRVSAVDPSPSRTYTEITTDQLSQDFTANTLNYTISGTMTFYGSPLAGVTMNGLPGTPVTNASGFYAASVPHGWSGTVIPELIDYIFDPPSRTYASITSDYVNQYYAATFVGIGQDDPLEENDDINNATEITPDTYTNMQLFDDDWYLVDVAEGRDLKVTVDGANTKDIDVELYNGSGDRIVGAYGVPEDEIAYASDLAAGAYYIRVIYLGTTGFWNSYTLTVEMRNDLGGGDITGRVTNVSEEPLEDIEVTAYDTQSDHYYTTSTDADGEYEITLIPSFYKILFDGSLAQPNSYESEYFDDKKTFEGADEIEVQEDMIIFGIDAVLDLESILSVVTTALPDGNLGTSYAATLEAAGGTESYEWDLASGSGPLPDGLVLHSDGQIDGTPTILGTFSFTVEVIDSSPSPQTATQALSITINPYAGTDYVISGTVTPALAGVVMSGFPGNPATDGSGHYTAYVYSGWSGTVTPILSGYAFDPASRTYNDVSGDIPGENYTASTGYVISGQISLDGTPLKGVLMSGLPSNPYTEANGQYSGAVPSGWTGIVTPTLPGFDFTPEFISYSTPVTSNQQNQNYTASYVGNQDDTYEDNDDFASAAEISLGTHTNLVLLDADWFKVYVSSEAEGKDLKVHIKGTSYPDPTWRRDLDFFVLDSDEKLLSMNYCGSDDEIIFLTDVAEGWYYIGQTYVKTGAVYSMTVEVSDNFGIGYISGRVTDEKTGQGIEGVYVEINADPFDWYVSHPLITTGADGYYKIGYLPGNYRVRFNQLNLHHRDPWAPDVNYIGETYNSNEIVPIMAGTTVSDINAELIPGGVVTGRVTDPDGNGIWLAAVYLYASDNFLVSSGYSDANGYYSAERMRTGNYKLRFSGGYGSNYGSVWYTDAGSFDKGHPVAVREGTTTPDVDTQLIESGSIEGRVTDSNGSPIQDVYVAAYDVSGIYLTGVYTDDNGEYRINNRLPEGDVVLFSDASSLQGNYVSEYYTDKFLLEEAGPITVQSGQTTYGIDAELAEGGTISGRVTDGQGDGVQDVFVFCVDLNSDRNHYATPDADGNYALSRLLPGDYKVCFEPSSRDDAFEWYNNENSFSNGDVVSVLAGQTTQGINAQLESNAGSITGRVTNSSGVGIEGVVVWARDSTKEVMSAYSAWTDSQGFYTIERMPTGNVKIQFDADYRYPYYVPFVSEYYNDKGAFENADPVPTTLGQTTPGINAVLASIPPVNITTTTLSNGEVAVPYEVALEVTGGREFYHWSLISGSLPPGLMLNSRGEITGTPMASGTYNFTVRVTDSSLNPQLIDTQTLSITIDAYQGAGYLVSGSVTFNDSPLPGVLMQGLPGNPMTSATGEYIVAVEQGWTGTVTPALTGYYFDPANRDYTDVASNQSNQNFAAYELTLNISTDFLPNGTEGYPYSQALDAEGGIEPYTWSLASGTLPDGLTLESSGTISGTPSNPGYYEFTVRVSDSSSPVPQYLENAFNITIEPAGGYPEGMVSYWKFEEGSGTTAYDSVGDYNGTVFGATWTDGQVQGALSFDGVDDYVGFNTHDFINTSNSFSYSVWVKFNNDIVGSGSGPEYEYDQMIISIHDGPYLYLGTSGRMVSLARLSDGSWANIKTDAMYTWESDEWYHIGVTLDSSKMRIYVNGNLENEIDGGLKRNSGDSFHIKFGKMHYLDSYYLDGAIDELAIFDRALTPEEIEQHYQNGLDGLGYEVPSGDLTLTTSSLPDGNLATNYSANLEAVGGQAPYFYDLAEDSGPLPDGLILHSSSHIEGTPTTLGTFSFTARVTDSSQNQLVDTKNLSITINAYQGTGYLISGAVTFNGSPLPGVVMQGLPGNPVTSANGEYIVDVDSGWTGWVTPEMSGYFFDPEFRSYVNVSAHQENQNYNAHELTLKIINDWLLNGTEGIPYNQTLEAQGGTGPYTWSLVSGFLPFGLNLDSDGNISGTPSRPGNYDFTVQITDSSSPSQMVNIELRLFIHGQENLSETPILYWKFNEGSGSTAYDSSGRETNGQLYQNAAFTSDSLEGTAVETFGKGWIQTGGFFIADEATISAYIKIADIAHDRFIWKLQYEIPHLGWPNSIEINLEIRGSNLTLFINNRLFDINNPGHEMSVDLSDPASGFVLDEYNQIVVSMKDDQYKIYINGSEKVSGQRDMFEIHDNVQIFWAMAADWAEYFLDGQIDELAIYNRLLSPQEVTEYYASGPMPTVSGTIHLDGSPLQGVWMDGLNSTTNENGEYIAPVLPGWSGTVTPSYGGYYFDPPSRTYENVTSGVTNQNYTAYQQGALWITTNSIPDGTKNQPYSATLTADGGTEPYTWSVVSGRLPAGLTLNADGEITGTPTEAGDFSFTGRVVDSSSPKQAAEQVLYLFISAEHQGFWTTTYPFGGNMHAQGLAIDPVDPDIVFAAAENRGIYKTTDGGMNWTNIIEAPDWPFGETDYGMFKIHNGSHNYYTCTGGRICMSADGGETWETIYEPEEWDISTFTVDPTSTAIIYAGTWEGEMYKTTDGGENWYACGTGLPSESIRTIVVDSNTPSTLYVGTFNSGIYKSVDSGANWLPTNNNIGFQRVEDIVIDPDNSDIIYIAVWYEYAQGLFRSIDAGASWELLYSANVEGQQGDYIIIDQTNADIIYFASDQFVFKSIDGGSNWTEYSVSPAIISGIIIDPADSQTLYAATRGEGVCKSEDGGQTWTPVKNGIRALKFPGGCPHGIEIDATNPNYIYAGSINGGYRSTDGGSSWEKMDHPYGSLMAIRTHPDAPGVVYSFHDYLLLSTDYGRSGTWGNPDDVSLRGLWRGDLGIASDDPDILYVSSFGGESSKWGVHKSEDRGLTWTQKNNGLACNRIECLAVHPDNHDIVFAGTRWDWPFEPSEDYGLYKTIDGGDNWSRVTYDLPEDIFIRQIVIYPDDPNIMYLLGNGETTCGLFRSNDGGQSWWQVSQNCGYAIAVAPANPDLVFMGEWDGFYVSLNGGQNWMQFNDGIPPNPWEMRGIDVIALDPDDPYHVFIGTYAGVYEATFTFDFMILTDSLPSGVMGEPYSVTLETAGGKSPITWEMLTGGLPEGLTFSESTGEISGTPLEAGYWDIVVKATDNDGKSYTKQYGLNVYNKYGLSVGTDCLSSGGFGLMC